MNECERMRDAMVEVAGHRVTWNDRDAAHLAQCDDCRASWTVVSTAAALGRAPVVDGSRIAAAVQQRLHATPLPAPRTRWGRIAMGAAAAALISIGTTSSYPATTIRPAQIDAENVTAMFPELESLSEPQLEVILATVADPDSVLSGGATLPRLGDLNDEQLEELLLSVESE